MKAIAKEDNLPAQLSGQRHRPHLGKRLSLVVKKNLTELHRGLSSLDITRIGIHGFLLTDVFCKSIW